VATLTERSLKQSLADDVYNRILDRLLKNELVPGDILNRRAVAEEMGVSVAPVLEAFLRLKIEGFIVSIPRKGTVVKAIRTEDVVDHLLLREALECQAARLYCGGTVEENEEALRNFAARLDRSDPDTPDHWRQEIQFHRYLVQLARSRVLLDEYTKAIQLGVFYRMNRLLVPRDRLERASHAELVERLKTKEPEVAERIMRQHLRSGKGRIFDELGIR
jgi:DNA-binding GntR family transcriptional regulator